MLMPFIFCTLSAFCIGIVGSYAIRVSAADVDFTPLHDIRLAWETRANELLVSIVDGLLDWFLGKRMPIDHSAIVSCEVISKTTELEI